MPRKKSAGIASGPQEGTTGTTPVGESLLVSMARSVGSTLGTAERKAGKAAEELKTMSIAARKSAEDATRSLGKSAEKLMRGKAGGRKTSAKKKAAPKAKARKSAGRRK